MIGQSLYYLNSTVYITEVSNLETVVMEMTNFYTNKSKRNVVIVQPKAAPDGSEMQLAEIDYNLLADAIVPGFSETIEYKTFDEVANADYISNSEKTIIMFAQKQDMLECYARYISGLLRAANFYPNHQQTAIDFICKVTEFDDMYGFLGGVRADIDTREFITNILTDIENTPEFTITYENGKNFSYDLLFFLNDYYPCAEVRSIIVEKFTIQGPSIAKDAIEQFTSQRKDLAYLLAVIDWMNDNGYEINKSLFVREVYMVGQETANHVAAFYKILNLWNQVKDNEDFKAAHTSRVDTIDGWDYNDMYNEINHLLPAVKRVLERDWDIDNISDQMKLMDTDVQFFGKRQHRIPYLIHKYKL